MGVCLGWPWTQGVRVKAAKRAMWKRAEIRNGGDRQWSAVGGGEPPAGEDQCQSGLVASCFILLRAKNTYTPRHGVE
jgi:hypothetical protein